MNVAGNGTVTGGVWGAIIAGGTAAGRSGNGSGVGSIDGSGGITPNQSGRSVNPGGNPKPPGGKGTEGGANNIIPGHPVGVGAIDAGANGSDENGDSVSTPRNQEPDPGDSGSSGSENRVADGIEPVIEIPDAPKRGRGRPPKDAGAKRDPAKPQKAKRKKFSEDKDLMDRLIAGMQVGGDILDLGFTYGLGLRSGIWKLSEKEAAVFARIIARRADEGNANAIAQIESLVNYADYVEAGMIVIDKTVATIAEVKTHGANPFFLNKPSGDRNGDKSSGKPSD